MKQKLNNPWNVFALGVILLTSIFFLFRIDLFPGEIITKNKIYSCDISLSYFIGMGGTKEQFSNIESFHLLPKGYALAIVILFGFPGLIAYRIHLGKQKKQNLLENSKK
jgi:hypothetical protein